MNKIMRLKDCAFYVSQKINSEILDKNTYVSTENILQNRLGKTIASFTPKNNTKVTHFKPKDILIANIRPYLKKIWFANHEGGCSADVLVLRAKSHTDSSFLYYSLFRDDFFSYIMKGAKGTRMPRGDKEQILNFNIPN
ncbi:type I restriction endonuclease subunit S, partial [Gilliamella apicola]